MREERTKLYVMCGKMAAGKSTYARELARAKNATEPQPARAGHIGRTRVEYARQWLEAMTRIAPEGKSRIRMVTVQGNRAQLIRVDLGMPEGPRRISPRERFAIERAVDPRRMRSERLRYQPIEPENLEAFHRLVQDEHVRRYMMDGNVLPRDWSEERIRESQALFTEIVADVDEINAASVRVLEKLGFERIAVQPGAFGNLLLFRITER